MMWLSWAVVNDAVGMFGGVGGCVGVCAGVEVAMARAHAAQARYNFKLFKRNLSM